MGPRWVHSRQRLRRARPAAAAAAAAAAAPARGSTKREDKDSLTVGPRTAVRRLARRGEDKDLPGFLIFPHSSTPPPRLRRLPRLRRAVSTPRCATRFCWNWLKDELRWKRFSACFRPKRRSRPSTRRSPPRSAESPSGDGKSHAASPKSCLNEVIAFGLLDPLQGQLQKELPFLRVPLRGLLESPESQAVAEQQHLGGGRLLSRFTCGSHKASRSFSVRSSARVSFS